MTDKENEYEPYIELAPVKDTKIVHYGKNGEIVTTYLSWYPKKYGVLDIETKTVTYEE